MAHKRNYRSIAKKHLLHPTTGQIFSATLEVDSNGVLDILGYKAMLSKGHEARECNGDVRVRVVPGTHAETSHIHD